MDFIVYSAVLIFKINEKKLYKFKYHIRPLHQPSTYRLFKQTEG